MRTIRLPQVQNVGPNQRASIKIPLGMVYEKLYFRMGGNILVSLITNIVLKINTKECQRWATAADMNALNGYKGIDNAFGAPATVYGNTSPGTFAGQNGQSYTANGQVRPVNAGLLASADASLGGMGGLLLLAAFAFVVMNAGGK